MPLSAKDETVFRNFLSAAGLKLHEEELHSFVADWEYYLPARKQIITPAGEHENYLYFVLEGVQRVYFFDEHNHEATLVFTYPPSFAGVLDAFLLHNKSKYFFEALTKSRLCRIKRADFEKWATENEHVSAFVRQMVYQVVSGLLERLAELQSFSSEEKFTRLLHRSPHILHLVPHKYLANYLGIDPTNFSKLLNQHKI